MKTKKITIKIKSLEDALDEFVDTANKVRENIDVSPIKETYVASPETARAIFTDARLKIIKLLKSKTPQSIYELAKILKRDFKNVYEDICFLEELGIIKVEESTMGRKTKKPILICERILFDIAA